MNDKQTQSSGKVSYFTLCNIVHYGPHGQQKKKKKKASCYIIFNFGYQNLQLICMVIYAVGNTFKT